MFQCSETKALFSLNIAALLFINTIENETLTCPDCASQDCLMVRACVVFLQTSDV